MVVTERNTCYANRVPLLVCDPLPTHRGAHLEEDYLLQVGHDLLELLLIVEEGGMEGDPGGHAIHLDPQVLQAIIGHL